MNIFPITKNSDEFDDVSEILGYQVLDSKGLVIGSGETEQEAKEKALVSMYLAECNSKPLQIKLGQGFLRKKTTQKR